MRMGRKCVANKDAHLRGGEQRTSFVERSQEAGLVSCLHYPARGGGGTNYFRDRRASEGICLLRAFALQTE